MMNSGETTHFVFLYHVIGVQIIGLGIGLKEDKELNGVVSPPYEKNAISLKTFGELDKIKQRIVNLASSSCPRMYCLVSLAPIYVMLCHECYLFIYNNILSQALFCSDNSYFFPITCYQGLLCHVCNVIT